MTQFLSVSSIKKKRQYYEVFEFLKLNFNEHEFDEKTIQNINRIGL